jgi:hypothetical protein
MLTQRINDLSQCTVELLVNSVHGNGFLFSHIQTYFVLLAMSATVTLQIKCAWSRVQCEVLTVLVVLAGFNDGLRRFSASYTVPVFQSFWILLSVLAGKFARCS